MIEALFECPATDPPHPIVVEIVPTDKEYICPTHTWAAVFIGFLVEPRDEPLSLPPNEKPQSK